MNEKIKVVITRRNSRLKYAHIPPLDNFNRTRTGAFCQLENKHTCTTTHYLYWTVV